ncbi:MAG: hypothetical protein HC892_00285 [Saprospiraceae bacterium]|nr:hypothetical protein [Saprospiraceae bacterium]
MPDKLNKADLAIIEQSIRYDQPNFFLNRFLQGEYTGTWWRPVPDDILKVIDYPPFIATLQRWIDGYEAIYEIWDDLSQPDYFVELENGAYLPVTKEKYDAHDYYHLKRFRIQQEGQDIVFHHRHGFRLPKWFMDMRKAKQELRIILGGYGSGKTLNTVAEMLYYAGTLRHYRSLLLAPKNDQAEEGTKLANMLITDTVYEQKFLLKRTTRPWRFFLGSSQIGYNSVIETRSMERDSQKILTITADSAALDQAEGVENLTELRRHVSTRFRGMVGGRRRLGTLYLIANAEDHGNVELWDLYEKGVAGSREIYVSSPNTADNFYLTPYDLDRYLRNVGENPLKREQYLGGRPPQRSGSIFPTSTVDAMRSPTLDDLHDTGINRRLKDYIWEANGDLVTHWAIPPESGQVYMLVADPGTENPPERNSPVLMVFNITNFPTIPARLTEFWWVSGMGSPNPWISAYKELNSKYRTYASAFYDGTGFQAGYDSLPIGLNEIGAMPANFGGANKFRYLTLAKKIFADGHVKVPSKITPIIKQITGYKLPDTGIKQDIVAALLVLVYGLEPSYAEAMDKFVNEPVVPASRYGEQIEEDNLGRYDTFEDFDL